MSCNGLRIIDLWPEPSLLTLYVTLDKIFEEGSLSAAEEADLLELLIEITGVTIRVNF
ncbi:hypothetical protein Q6D67_18665 [Haliea sp. E1-2-M8]|uniref:hypothetical protein n=1 Tax=Haliea sp. E1-2-M8 TaxID=3064706 RepID=UPI00271DAE09|nr:hypothetical protein [Haliea sp. E1-2-M8]MDO8863719.1 hypothetical protein [Haliea sp. E1-2-M8]